MAVKVPRTDWRFDEPIPPRVRLRPLLRRVAKASARRTWTAVRWITRWTALAVFTVFYSGGYSAGALLALSKRTMLAVAMGWDDARVAAVPPRKKRNG